MQLRLLPSTFGPNGQASPAQHLTTVVIDEKVAVDAGSLALSGAAYHAVRDIIITHPHLDHTATLPIFIDDLFGTLEQPVRVHTTEEIKATLEANIFNWMVYPRFSELRNQYGPVMEYVILQEGVTSRVGHLDVTFVPVNHSVMTYGLLIDDGACVVAFSSDTSATETIWAEANRQRRLDAVLIECSFPDEMAALAIGAGHLTPHTLAGEIAKLNAPDCAILALHIKPAYLEAVTAQLRALPLKGLHIMEAGRAYCFGEAKASA